MGLLAEFVIIVLGVLAALAVDEWREGRAERERAVEIVESFIRDLRTDSADFADLPGRALSRVMGAHVLLREFHPDVGRDERVRATVDSLQTAWDIPPVPASDTALRQAMIRIHLSSDLDIATGAYRDFADGGSSRLVENDGLRDRIHDYYYQVDVNRDFDEVATHALNQVIERGMPLGVTLGTDGDWIRRRLSADDPDDQESYFTALLWLQSTAVVQAEIAGNLGASAGELLAALRAERDRLTGD